METVNSFMDTKKEIENLREKYLELTEEKLPKKAKKNNWEIRFDHCFQRVTLDNIFNDEWYGYLDHRSDIPAYKQMSRRQLMEAINIAKQMYNSEEKMEELNQKSLDYRDKEEDDCNKQSKLG